MGHESPEPRNYHAVVAQQECLYMSFYLYHGKIQFIWLQSYVFLSKYANNLKKKSKNFFISEIFTTFALEIGEGLSEKDESEDKKMVFKSNPAQPGPHLAVGETERLPSKTNLKTKNGL